MKSNPLNLLPIEQLESPSELRREIRRLRERFIAAAVVAACGWICFVLVVLMKP